MMEEQTRVEQVFTNKDACLQALNLLFAQEPKPSGAAIKVYLKNFAGFNETFGFWQGEALLRQVVSFLLTLPGAQIYRMSGRVRFILLLPGAGLAQAEETARRITERFEGSWLFGDIDCICAVDVGVLMYPDYAETPEDLLDNLDVALDESGRAGQNQITVFDETLKERQYRKTVIAKLLVNAVAGGNIDTRYLPVFSVEKQRYTRAETQVRLLTLEFGPVCFSEFDPIAQESGVICSVNRYFLKSTCADIRRLLDEGVEFESITTQISPVLFIQQSFVSEVADLLEHYRIPAKKLAFEICESPISAHISRTVIERLSALGIEIILAGRDLACVVKDILELPLDTVKLGRLLVWQLRANPRSGPLIEALIRIAENMGIKLIADGVETEQQVQTLNSYNCPYRQGSYHSEPVTLAEIQKLLG